MRSGRIIGAGLVVLTLGAILLVLSPGEAEARGRGARGGARSVTTRSAVLIPTGTVAGAVAQSRVGADHAGSDPALRPVKPVLAPALPVREVRAGEPWCANQRVVGSGSGFCLIN